jgi:hypothetical protein
VRLFNCGGNWNNGANAGVFYANGNNSRANTNTNLGFRSALPPSQILQTQGFAFSTEVIKGSVSPTCTAGRKKLAAYTAGTGRCFLCVWEICKAQPLGEWYYGKAQACI